MERHEYVEEATDQLISAMNIFQQGFAALEAIVPPPGADDEQRKTYAEKAYPILAAARRAMAVHSAMMEARLSAYQAAGLN